jgi:hypothetical protein
MKAEKQYQKKNRSKMLSWVRGAYVLSCNRKDIAAIKKHISMYGFSEKPI